MKIFCDTSVIVAALDTAHPRHAESLRIVQPLRPGEGICALHSVAECFATLTGMRRGGRVLSPAFVVSALRPILRLFTVQRLDTSDYMRVVERLAHSGWSGGVIYDALIFECAYQAKVDVIFTLDLDDFRRVATPEWVRRIQAP